MSRISAIETAEATGKAKQLLEGVQAKLGITPNLMKTLAHAPAALEGYLNFNGALAHGVLNPKFREKLAITIAQANSCEYCLSAHTAIGGMAGVPAAELAESRLAHSADPKQDAGLQFAQKVVVQRGEVSDRDLEQVRTAGYSDAEIVEIIGHVGLNIFTNYFNHVAQTVVDFPRVPVAMEQAA
jgi:uncharacterized peroxidase-related enzyme